MKGGVAHKRPVPQNLHLSTDLRVFTGLKSN